VMENASLPSDVWNTTSDHDHDEEHDDHEHEAHTHLAHIRDFFLKIIYIVIATVGVLDNLFVLVVFIFFIKITNKVRASAFSQ